MGYGFIPTPGKHYCKTCDHRDCAALRRDAKKKCPLCGKGFDPEQKFYMGDQGPEHAVCVWKREDRLRES